jgi:predicted enzyme related to lactoylglutathione lyase
MTRGGRRRRRAVAATFIVAAGEEADTAEATAMSKGASGSGGNVGKGKQRLEGEVEVGYIFGCLDSDQKLWKSKERGGEARIRS